MIHRRLALPLALVGAVIVGVVVTVAVRGGAPAPAAPAPPPVTTATVVRTDLDTTVLTGATLGFAPTEPVVNRLTGTYTQLPPVGAVIAAGQVLYRVDNQPVVLMAGTTPAWRPFAPGMTDGPDVAELQSNLIALGDTAGLFSTASGHFDAPTVNAIERWQRGRSPARNRPDRSRAGGVSPRGRPCRSGELCHRSGRIAQRPPLSGHHNGPDGDGAAQSQPPASQSRRSGVNRAANQCHHARKGDGRRPRPAELIVRLRDILGNGLVVVPGIDDPDRDA